MEKREAKQLYGRKKKTEEVFEEKNPIHLKTPNGRGSQ